MHETDHQPSPEQIYFLNKQQVTLPELKPAGFTLDIGGGGEGVIGQLIREKVIAVDISQRELEEAPDGPLKAVMDARKLSFLKDSFSTAAAFFSLMYIPGKEHSKVFQEVHRVIKPGGTFYLWDIDLPSCLDQTRDLVAFHLEINLPGKLITTGYGTRWPQQNQGLSHYQSLAEKQGFLLEHQDQQERIIQITLRKKNRD